MSIEKYIKNHIGRVADKVYIAPKITEKKLNAAISNIAKTENPDCIIGIIDTSVFSNVKDGMVIFGDKIVVRLAFEKPVTYLFSKINKSEYVCEEVVKSNGKIEKNEKVVFHFIDGSRETVCEKILGINIEKLSDLINGILLYGGEDKSFTSRSQLLPLSGMDEEVKLTYLKIICNFCYSYENIIDSMEYSEIISLVARIDLEKSYRLRLRQYMCSNFEIVDTFDLIDYLNKNVVGNFDVLKQSLMKDILYIHKRKECNDVYSNEFITNLKQSFNIADEQIEVIIDAIKRDEDIIKLRMKDDQIKKSFKELVASAGAVGIPMAALYFSGSVVGLSAVGITSGLAALGMGGVLGFTSMATGVGALIAIGMVSYTGLKKVTGLKDLENNSQREAMLQAIIKNSQQALNYLVEDVNEITLQLNDAIQKGVLDEQEIKKLSLVLTKISTSSQFVVGKMTVAEIEELRSKIPNLLDITRLEQLTLEPIKQKYYQKIESCYIKMDLNELDESKIESNPELSNNTTEIAPINIGPLGKINKQKNGYVLKEDLSIAQLRELLNSLYEIGYYNLMDSTVASTKGLMKNLKDGISKKNNSKD